MKSTVLQIKKRSLCQFLSLYILVLPILLNFLQDVLYFPSYIRYTADVACLVVLCCLMITREQKIYKHSLPFVLYIIIFFLYAFVVYLFRYQSPIYFLWGLRNNFRYYVAFVAFISFLDKDDVRFCMSLLDVAFVVHSLVSFWQFFVLGYKWDYLGGIFGVKLGCNGYSLVLLVIICVKSLIRFMNNEEKLRICLIKCSVSLLIAIMAELKVFFLLLPIIVIGAAAITKFSLRKIYILICVLLVMVAAGGLFTVVWGNDSALSLDRIMQLITADSYSSAGDLGRYTALPVISESFLVDTPSKLFGLGLGNCDTSSFDICNTPFFKTYSHLNYLWLSSASLLLEMGYLGLVFVIAFFVLVIIMAQRRRMRHDMDSSYCQIAILMSVMCIVLIFYNSSLRTDIGYVPYFILAIPFIADNGEKNVMLNV